MSTLREPSTLTVALIGNPNTGKSTLFGALVGVRQHVGNYPGVTVEKKTGDLQHAGRRYELIDLPVQCVRWLDAQTAYYAQAGGAATFSKRERSRWIPERTVTFPNAYGEVWA